MTAQFICLAATMILAEAVLASRSQVDRARINDTTGRRLRCYRQRVQVVGVSKMVGKDGFRSSKGWHSEAHQAEKYNVTTKLD